VVPLSVESALALPEQEFPEHVVRETRVTSSNQVATNQALPIAVDRFGIGPNRSSECSVEVTLNGVAHGRPVSKRFGESDCEHAFRGDPLHLLDRCCHHCHRLGEFLRPGCRFEGFRLVELGFDLGGPVRHCFGEGVENRDLVGPARREYVVEYISYSDHRIGPAWLDLGDAVLVANQAAIRELADGLGENETVGEGSLLFRGVALERIRSFLWQYGFHREEKRLDRPSLESYIDREAVHLHEWNVIFKSSEEASRRSTSVAT